MANKSIFSSFRGSIGPKADSTNKAGGRAYAFSDRHALAQYAATGTISQTFYASASDQLDNVLELTSSLDPDFIARTAIYSRQRGHMKDMPALLCAILASRDMDRLATIFHDVIDNGKMLRNFVQIIRSGITGRKSLGSAPRRLVREWFERADDDTVFRASIGNAPSLADVIKMVHPRPMTASREALYAYLIGKPYDADSLPQLVRDFEHYKKTLSGQVPNVPFQMLTSLDLDRRQWSAIARNAGWQMTRMNLNTFARHDVLKDTRLVKLLSQRLRDKDAIRKARAFPYQLMVAYLNAGTEVPAALKNALQDAMEVALENVPRITGNVVVAPDVSGSMHGSITGYRAGASSSVRHIDVAALVAAAILRKNPEATVLPFESDVVPVTLNPRDTVMTNARILSSLPCGGTNCSAALDHLIRRKAKVDMLIYVSDNESWMDSPHYGYFGGGKKTAALSKWEKLKNTNPNAKMVCLDIAPYDTTQAKERGDIMNIGGFSDQVFDAIASFNNSGKNHDYWVTEIEKIPLRGKLAQSA